MKKLLCMILALIMVLGLCACGQESSTNNGGNNNNESTSEPTEDPIQETTLPLEPTEDEKTILREYVRAMCSLNEHCTNSQAEPYSIGYLDRIQMAYTELLALDLDTVRLFADTEWAQWAYNKEDKPSSFNHPADWDCDAVLSRFTKVEDVKLTYTQTQTDHLGNITGPSEKAAWHYNTDGTFRSIDNESDAIRISLEPQKTGGSFYQYKNDNIREYDASGRLSKISFYSYDSVNMVCTFTYDAEGKLTQQTAKTNSTQRVYTYSYDANGHLVKIDWPTSANNAYNTEEILYTYDASGNLVKEEYTKYEGGANTPVHIAQRYSMEYVYDSSNKLVSGTYTHQEWRYNKNQGNYINEQTQDQYAFELDAQGRLVKEIVTPGDTIWVQTNKVASAAKYSQIVYETVYGDYYVYTPAA